MTSGAIELSSSDCELLLESLDVGRIDSEDRDAWRIIIPTRVSGRRVHNRTERWSFHPAGYI